MTPAWSVVLPTRNRRRTLTATLDAVVRQQDAPPFEVVVVDDGSTDDTAAWLDATRFDVPVRRVAAHGDGPARARNAGIRAARGEWLALLGDDTEPVPGWLAAHQRARDGAADARAVAVVGRIDWHPRLRVTPFLTFLNEDGPQFGWGLIEDPASLPFNFCYGSNLSIARDWLIDEPYDERFGSAAWEDIELGYRLTRRGVRLAYAPAAIAWHDHPTTVVSHLRRQHEVGRSAGVFRRIHPELDGFLGFANGRPPPAPSALSLRLLEWTARALEPLPVAVPRLWRALSQGHYARGCHDATRGTDQADGDDS